MRSIRKFAALAFAAVLSSSCGQWGRSACQVDQFFCSPMDGWEAQASRLTTERVFELHLLEKDYYRPSAGVLLRVLGDRGEETVVILLSYLREHEDKRERTFYIPILMSVIERSRYDFCHSRHLNALSDLLTSNDRRLLRDHFCVSMFGTPPEN